MEIIVAGGGIGGLAAAIGLVRDGHQVTVLERSATIGWGQGVQLSPNAIQCLASWGLADAVLNAGQLVDRADKWTRDGLLLRRRRLGIEGGFEHPHAVISRGKLQSILFDRALAEGAEVRLRHAVQGYRRIGDGVEVDIRDLENDSGGNVTADLLVGADGIHSAVRRQMYQDDSPQYTGYVQYRAVTPLELAAEARQAPGTITVYGDDKNFYSYYQMNQEEISFGACIHVGEHKHPEESWASEGDPEEIINHFHEYPGPLRQIVRNTPYLARMHIFDHATLPGWCDGPVSLLGDAAHAMLPFAGQATVSAIEDAALLCDLLAGPEAPLTELLRQYESERRLHAARIRDFCRERGGVFEEYIVARQLQDSNWEQRSKTERQDFLSAIDWAEHDSFLRELY